MCAHQAPFSHREELQTSLQTSPFFLQNYRVSLKIGEAEKSRRKKAKARESPMRQREVYEEVYKD